MEPAGPSCWKPTRPVEPPFVTPPRRHTCISAIFSAPFSRSFYKLYFSDIVIWRKILQHLASSTQHPASSIQHIATPIFFHSERDQLICCIQIWICCKRVANVDMLQDFSLISWSWYPLMHMISFLGVFFWFVKQFWKQYFELSWSWYVEVFKSWLLEYDIL